MDNIELVYWDHHYNGVLLLNLVIVIAVFASLRFFSGITSHINASKELTERDNPAFGVSMAGVVLAVTIILTGAIYGNPIYTFEESVVSVGLYGAIGIFLMAITRVIFNKIALPAISIKDEISKGNIAAGIVDAGNVVATAIIIRAMMMWVDANTVEGLGTILIGFIISQIILTTTTIARIKLLNRKISLQSEFKARNIALALRFSGRKIGTAFAVAAASHLLVFESYDMPMLVATWAGASAVMVVVLTMLSFVANKIIFAGTDINDEVIKQRNIGLGAVQCVIYICLGMLLSELMS